MKRLTCALVLLATVLAGGCGMAIVPNPDYDSWADFKPGSYITFEGTQTDTAIVSAFGQEPTESVSVVDKRVTEELIELTPNQATLKRTEIIFDTDGNPLGEPSVGQRIEKADIFASDNPLTDPGAKVDRDGALHPVEVNGVTIMCTKTDVALSVKIPIVGLLFQEGGIKSTLYTREDIPGGLVKGRLESYGAHGTQVIEGQIVDFKVVKE